MNIQKLIDACEKQKIHPVLGGSNAKIQLMVKGRWGSSNRKKLMNVKGAPFGVIIADANDTHVLAVFRCQEVIDFLKNSIGKIDGIQS
jgi:hypothetical protein